MDRNNNVVVSPEADPGMEGMLIGRAKADETPIGQKLNEPEDYDANMQVVGVIDLERSRQRNHAENIGMCVVID